MTHSQSHSATQHALTLTAVAEQFTQWRATRAHRRSPVPPELRQQALDLLQTHLKSQVIHTLGINSAMLKNWQHSLPGAPTNSAAPDFIPLDIPAPTLAMASPIDVTFTRGAAEPLRLQGSLTLSQLTAVAQGLRG